MMRQLETTSKASGTTEPVGIRHPKSATDGPEHGVELCIGNDYSEDSSWVHELGDLNKCLCRVCQMFKHIQDSYDVKGSMVWQRQILFDHPIENLEAI